MRKTLATLAATGAIALGGLSAAPKPANAAAWWVAPAIVGGVIVGGAAGAAAGSGYYAAEPYAYAPGNYAYAPRYYSYAPRYYLPRQPYDAYASEVYVQPSECYWARQRVPGGWARVRICD